MTLKIGSLFSGYGGLDLAIHAAFGSVETAWVSDVEPGPCKVLAHRYPHAPNLGDITRVDWSQVEPVDIIAGGSPCQDLSTAGRRAGMRAGTRSGLWENMRLAIDTLKPAAVVWENVLGALSATATTDSQLEFDQGPLGDRATGFTNRALGRLLGDLSSLGYDAQWTTLRASTLGACHHRDRVFVLATRRGVPTDTLRRGTGWRGNAPRHGKGEQPDSATQQPDSPPRGAVLKVLPTVTTQDTDSPCELQLARNTIPLNSLIGLLPTPDVRGDNRKTERFGNGGNNFHDIAAQARWREYMPAIRRQEQAFGRAAPAPTTSNPRTGRPQLSARFTEWMMGLPDGWITDTPDVTRAEAIRMCGNGVVPQQAAVALTFLATLIEENA